MKKAVPKVVTLILNACEGALQIVATDAEYCPVVVQEWFLPNKGTEILAPALQQICQTLEMRASEFQRIACVNGPGSFTGIRLTLATAAGLRRTGQALLASLNYLQTLAMTLVQKYELTQGAIIWVATHARRNLVHAQSFLTQEKEQPIRPISEVELIAPEELALRLKDKQVYTCGSGFQSAKIIQPTISALCCLARQAEYSARDLDPFYVRPCDAVQNLANDPDANQKLQELLNKTPVSEV